MLINHRHELLYLIYFPGLTHIQTSVFGDFAANSFVDGYQRVGGISYFSADLP
jgi:hypothetical protein